MTEREPVEVTNLDRYGNPALPWSRPSGQFAGATGPELAYFLSTCGQDGRPHSTGIGALWDDGDLYFVSGPGTRKSRNLAANPACAVSVRLRGIDLVVEGDAVRVTEPAALERLAARYRDSGWPAEVSGDAFTAPFSAPSAGPPPWQLYRLAPRTAFGVATEEPHGATRWRF
jgi:hypothetical protein